MPDGVGRIPDQQPGYFLYRYRHVRKCKERLVINIYTQTILTFTDKGVEFDLYV